jgi:TRAP-type C4-dicarboxylate transport system permease small subunit
LREHIAIDLFATALSFRKQCWQAAIGDLLCAIVSGVLAWRIWTRGQSLLAVGETTMQLGVPRGLVALAMSGLMAAAAVVFVFASATALRAAIAGEER